MFELEPIAKHNGWAMAVTGGTIVFLSLVFLSFVVSQFHKVILFYEKIMKNKK